MRGNRIAIIGGGPAGLMAADVLSRTGHGVTVYDGMPTFGRKFLLAGKSGLNITHSEDYVRFRCRFGAASGRLRAALDGFTPDDVQAFTASLGIETFVGTSGRVFPNGMKASPLLRAWLARLTSQGTTFKTRHRLVDFLADGPVFDTPDGRRTEQCAAVLLALGGASWPRLGADGTWVPLLRSRGVDVADFRPANCGFDVAWSAVFKERYGGAPVKSVMAAVDGDPLPGEFVISGDGIEGSLVYAHAAALRDRLGHRAAAQFVIDLAPGRSVERLTGDLSRQGRKASLSNRLRKGAGLDGVKAALVRELLSPERLSEPHALAASIKALPIPVLRPRPIAEAISCAGGIRFTALDNRFMLRQRPGTFAAGEMLDWEAPTGGYLLTACLATGKAAAVGLAAWLAEQGEVV